MANKILHANNGFAGGMHLNVAVPVNTVADQLVRLGTQGLYGYTLTARATNATIAAGTAAPGLADGQATVRLPGVDIVTRAQVAGAASFGAKVYEDGAGGYTFTAGTNTHVGYWLDGTGTNLTGRIAIVGVK